MRLLATPPVEMRELTERKIISALTANNPADPIVIEVMRLKRIYIRKYKVLAGLRRSNPESFLSQTPDTAIEAVALHLAARKLGLSEAQRTPEDASDRSVKSSATQSSAEE